MKRITILTAIVFLFSYTVYGQITTRETPLSFGANVPILTKNEKSMKSFASLDMKRVEQEDAEDSRKGIPPRFGYPHEAGFTLENSGEWVVLANGDRLWRLIITCQDALTINLLYDKFWIPEGAKFFVYGHDHKQVIGAVTSANNKGDRDDIQGFATGLIKGDKIILEYFLPKVIKETGIISIDKVVHGYRYIQKSNKMYGSSGACNINVNCSQGQSWQSEKNAVAMILVNGYRICSGSLINTTANDGRPMFLTANHCLSSYGNDAISAPNLNTWSFYWHYESPGCVSSSDPPYISTTGAVTLANSKASDFALLRLTEDPKNAVGVTPYYLGWDRSGNAGTGGVGVHHPSGDIKKISVYSITPTTMTYPDTSVAPNAHWRVIWNDGTTEGGSSGSPLINNNRSIIGQLNGGSASCMNLTGYDSYGKFSVSWTGNGASDNRRRLRDWLDPNNTGVSVLGGCNGIVNFTNQTVTSNTTVTSCGSINIQSVTVTSTGALDVRANNKITITPPFNAVAGSSLIFKTQ
jgi:lysyl endopeptidase